MPLPPVKTWTHGFLKANTIYCCFSMFHYAMSFEDDDAARLWELILATFPATGACGRRHAWKLPLLLSQHYFSTATARFGSAVQHASCALISPPIWYGTSYRLFLGFLEKILENFESFHFDMCALIAVKFIYFTLLWERILTFDRGPTKSRLAAFSYFLGKRGEHYAFPHRIGAFYLSLTLIFLIVLIFFDINYR